jgi:hypothetical protein
MPTIIGVGSNEPGQTLSRCAQGHERKQHGGYDADECYDRGEDLDQGDPHGDSSEATRRGLAPRLGAAVRRDRFAPAIRHGGNRSLLAMRGGRTNCAFHERDCDGGPK